MDHASSGGPRCRGRLHPRPGRAPVRQLTADSCATLRQASRPECLPRRHHPYLSAPQLQLLGASQATHPYLSRSGYAKQVLYMADLAQARPAALRLTADQSQGQSQGRRQMPSQTPCERLQQNRNRLRLYHLRRRQQPGRRPMAFKRLPYNKDRQRASSAQCTVS